MGTIEKEKERDRKRKEFILNTVLTSCIVLTGIAFFVTLINPILYGSAYKGENFWIVGIFFSFLLFLSFLSRKGKSLYAAIFLILALFLLAISANYRWGVTVPQILLLYSLIVVMSGILIGTKFVFIITGIIASVYLGLAYTEITRIHFPDYSWIKESVRIGEAIVYMITLTIIAVISWLANREIERSFIQELASEEALKRERDLLERRVVERTRELKKAQREKMNELSHFAEFGRFSSGLLHDLVNPLNLISLNLEQLDKKSKQMSSRELSEIRTSLERAITGTQQLQQYIQAAKRQVQNQEIRNEFSLNKEIEQSLAIFTSTARLLGAKILFIPKDTIKTFGNPVKFDQMLGNVVSNALDACEGGQKGGRIITVTLEKEMKKAAITISDTGEGIKKEHVSKIFDPLFTTKSFERGTGIGLSLCKKIIKKEFNGEISVRSKRHVGTTVKIIFPIIVPKINPLKKELKNT